MRSLELAVAIFRQLPPSHQVQAVEYIEQLHGHSLAERKEALRLTAGCLSEEEARMFETSIKESCERVDD